MNPEDKRAYMRRWWGAHPGYKKAYRAANLDRLREQDRVSQRLRMTPEKRRAAHQRERALNPARVRGREYAYQRAHPQVMNEIKRRYKMRKRGAFGGHHTLGEWREKLALFADLCVYCGLPKKLERDHDTPLSRGGTDLISNILPACRMCNLGKSARTAREYLALR